MDSSTILLIIPIALLWLTGLWGCITELRKKKSMAYAVNSRRSHPVAVSIEERGEVFELPTEGDALIFIYAFDLYITRVVQEVYNRPDPVGPWNAPEGWERLVGGIPVRTRVVCHARRPELVMGIRGPDGMLFLTPARVADVSRRNLPADNLYDLARYHAHMRPPNRPVGQRIAPEEIWGLETDRSFAEMINRTVEEGAREALINGMWTTANPMNPDQSIEDILAEAEKRRKKTEEAKQERLQAIKTSLELLYSCLNQVEYSELISFHTITINTKHGMFRVNVDMMGVEYSRDLTPYLTKQPPSLNIEGYKDIRYCANLGKSDAPYFDHILAQVLMLKNDPDKFLSIANRHGVQMDTFTRYATLP